MLNILSKPALIGSNVIFDELKKSTKLVESGLVLSIVNADEYLVDDWNVDKNEAM